jgi:hypothetical protein
VNMWLLFRWRNIGILAFLNTCNMVLANLTYLDSFNRSIVLCSYKALMALLWRTGFYWAFKTFYASSKAILFRPNCISIPIRCFTFGAPCWDWSIFIIDSIDPFIPTFNTMVFINLDFRDWHIYSSVIHH